jgi:hypothetical protein
MKKGKVFFPPLDGSASLTISWSSDPKGDAIEAKKGSGVGFFSDTGDLLCVIFDEVEASEDNQVLEFRCDRIELKVKNGKATYHVSKLNPKSLKDKKHSCRKPLNKSKI